MFSVGNIFTTIQALWRFAENMDRLGLPYGHSGFGGFLPPFAVRVGEPNDLHISDEPHAIIVISGKGYALGGAVRSAIVAGQGVWWPAREQWDIGADCEDMWCIEVEGPSLCVDDLRIR